MINHAGDKSPDLNLSFDFEIQIIKQAVWTGTENEEGMKVLPLLQWQVWVSSTTQQVFHPSWPPVGQAVADTGSLSAPRSIMSCSDRLKGRLNLDSPQQEAVDKVRPFVKPFITHEPPTVMKLDDCWDAASFSKLQGWPGIKDHGFIEQFACHW